ncbi:Putative accessory gland protein [Gryllus bimaculatus]|nr:Putative accessory gland protein [Gryllus bimaculatus]
MPKKSKPSLLQKPCRMPPNVIQITRRLFVQLLLAFGLCASDDYDNTYIDRLTFSSDSEAAPCGWGRERRGAAQCDERATGPPPADFSRASKQAKCQACPTCPGCLKCLSCPPCQATAPAGYKRHGDLGYYKLHHHDKPWNDAKNTCEREGGYLVVINSKNPFRKRFFGDIGIRKIQGNEKPSVFNREQLGYRAVQPSYLPEHSLAFASTTAGDTKSFSQDEAKVLNSIMNKFGYRTIHAGFYDPIKNRRFVTVLDNYQWYLEWAPSQPGSNRNRNCGTYTTRGLSTIYCTSSRPFVCELYA